MPDTHEVLDKHHLLPSTYSNDSHTADIYMPSFLLLLSYRRDFHLEMTYTPQGTCGNPGDTVGCHNWGREGATAM